MWKGWRLCIISVLLGPAAAPLLAVPACPAPMEVHQPDGTPVTVFLRGDERAHWHQDDQGFPVVQERRGRGKGASTWWVYAQQHNGMFKPTPHALGRTNPKALGLKRVNPKPLRRAAAADANLPVQSDYASPPAASTGAAMGNLVLLVNFADLAVEYSREGYEDLFNQIGYADDGAGGSVRDYYLEVSYGQLDVVATVVEPVTLDNGYAWYGGNDTYGRDLRPRDMIVEALAKLDQRGFDFTTVDLNRDNRIDGLCVIHAGGGEEYSGNNPNYIWSHMGSLLSAAVHDGVAISRYHTEPARRGWDNNPSSQGITRIGVICHEHGHFLGLPDLYDYGYDSRGVGDFCIMGYGCWNGDYGTHPAHFSAWCKMSLGWMPPTIVTSPGRFFLDDAAVAPQMYLLLPPGQFAEFFLIENRHGAGFDQYLPGSQRGILIWHIDTTRYSNDDQTRYRVDLEEASGVQHVQLNQNDGDDADYFREGSAAEFTETTTPNNLSYGGVPLGLNIVNVGPAGPTMSFDAVPPRVTISGHVRTFTGAAVANVELAATDGPSTTTDPNGFYQLTVPGGWSGTVTPSRANWTFEPAERSFSFMLADAADRDFAGYLPGDADGDATVGYADFQILYDHWSQSGDWAQGDFDGNGVIGFGDFQILLDHWGLN